MGDIASGKKDWTTLRTNVADLNGDIERKPTKVPTLMTIVALFWKSFIFCLLYIHVYLSQKIFHDNYKKG